MERLILGSNPFRGADHYLAERARLRAAQVTESHALEVVREAFESGADGFSCNADSVSYRLLRRFPEFGISKRFGVFAVVPNDEIVPAFLRSGTMGAVSELFAGVPLTSRARALIKGGLAWAAGNPLRAATTYLDIEGRRLADACPTNARIRSVLLHELVSDAILGLELRDAMLHYIAHVQDQLHTMPGFVTRNYPRFIEFCRRIGVDKERIIIMTPFNPIGFQMTPNRSACERAIREVGGKNLIAISLLAGGQLSLEDAIEYLRRIPEIQSVAVGASSKQHCRATFGTLSRILATSGSPES